MEAQRSAVDTRAWPTWLAAVNAHVPGTRDEAVTRLGPWSRSVLDSVLPALARQPPDEQLRLVGRALILHTDIAMLNRTAMGYTLPAASELRPIVQDGQVVGHLSGTFHWEFARRLLERLPRQADRLRLGRPYYRATAAVLQRWGEYPELENHLAAGLRLIEDDAVLLMYDGALRQAYGGARAQRFFDEQRREAFPPPSPGASRNATTLAKYVPPPDALPSASAARDRAQRLLRRALEVDPTLVEARIRLAHVLSDSRRHDEAAMELALARANPLPPLLDYYASLLSGREARTRGSLDEARQAYERAAALYPGAPAPHYGLSDLALIRGDREEALDHLLRAGANPRDEQAEPWWWIEREHAPTGIELTRVMWREILR